MRNVREIEWINKKFEKGKMIEQFYESIVRTNNRIIELTDEVMPMVFFVKDDEIIPEPLIITQKNKEEIKQAIKAKAVKGGYSYVLIVNTLAKRKKNGVMIEGECCIRAMYTPKTKILDMVWHKEGEVLATERIEGRKNLFQDSYDVWNEGGI